MPPETKTSLPTASLFQ